MPAFRSIVDIARGEEDTQRDEERERKRQEAMERRNVAERRDQPRRPEPPDERRERIAQDVLRIRGALGQAQAGLQQGVRAAGAARPYQVGAQELGRPLTETETDYIRAAEERKADIRGLEVREQLVPPPGLRRVVGAPVSAALEVAELADVPRRFIKEKVIEPTMGLVPGPVDVLKKAGLPDEIATPLGALIAGPAAPTELTPDTLKAEVASVVLDPINVAFFPAKTVQAVRAAVRTSPKLGAAVRAAGESPVVRRAGAALREAGVGRVGERGFAKVPGKPPKPEPGDVPRLPTMRETEARSARPPPEVRYELAGSPDTSRTLQPFSEVTELWGDRFQSNWWTSIEDTLGGVVGPLSRTPEARAVRRAMVQADIYKITQGARVRGRILDWWGRSRKVLGLEADGFARRIRVASEADIPEGLAQRLDHIIENPDKYIIGEKKTAALREAGDILEDVLRLEQSEGVDVAEVMGEYWPRVVTKTPKGDPLRGGAGAMRLPRVTPRHALPRAFGSIEEGWRLGYRYGNPLDSLFIRAESAVNAVANRNATRAVKGLGFKPSEAIRADIKEALQEAQTAFQEARRIASRKGAGKAEKVRFWEAEATLNNAKRLMRIEANQWARRQPQVFGRIVPAEVAEEFNRYITSLPEGLMDPAFQIMRANMIHGDLSAAGIQLWWLFWRDNPSWWKTLGYGVYSLTREPLGFAARNADVISRGTQLGAIVPPTEFLLRTGGGAARAFGRLPIVKPTQRAFEWMVFIGQTYRWKSMERLARNSDELLELAAVARKQSGVLMTPGLTSAQAQWVSKTWFAGKFAGAMHGALLDIAKGGPAGWEARKTLAMALSGALATTIGLNLKINGEMPNLTDPHKPGFLGVRSGPGFFYPLGPYQPFAVALARTAAAVNDVRQGKVPDKWDLQAWPRYVESKVSIPLRILIQAGEALGLPFSQIRGEPYEDLQLKTPADWWKQLTHYQPIGLMQAFGGFRQGFGAAGLEILGGRTTPLSPYRLMEEYAQEQAEKAPEGSEIANMAGRELREFSGAAINELERDPEFKELSEKALERRSDVSQEFARIDRKEGGEIELTGIWYRESRNPAAYANDMAHVRLTHRVRRQELFEEHGFEPSEPPEEAPEQQLVQQWAQFALAPSINEIEQLDGDIFGSLDTKFREIIGPDQEIVLDRQLNTKSDPILTQTLEWGTELREFRYDDIPPDDQKRRVRKREKNPVMDALLFLTRPTPYGDKRTVRTKEAQQEVIDRVWDAFGWKWSKRDVPIAQR